MVFRYSDITDRRFSFTSNGIYAVGYIDAQMGNLAQ